MANPTFRRFEAARAAFSDLLSTPDKQRDVGGEWRVYDKKNGKSIAAPSELAAKLAAAVLSEGEPRQLHAVAAVMLQEIAAAMPALAVYANGFVDRSAANEDAADFARELRQLAQRFADYAPVDESRPLGTCESCETPAVVLHVVQGVRTTPPLKRGGVPKFRNVEAHVCRGCLEDTQRKLGAYK